MTARAAALVVLVAAFNAADAQSTREVRLEAGAAQVQQTGRSASDAAAILGASWREGSPLFAVLISGAATYSVDSLSAAQARAAAAWRSRERSAWQTEGGMTAAAFGSAFLPRGGSFSGFVRERVAVDAGGFWAGGAFGGTSRDNLGSHSTALEIGAWLRSGSFDATASLGRMRSDDVSLLEAAGIFPSADGVAYDLTDAAANLRYEHGSFLLDASETLRHGARATVASQSALYLSATWAISPRFALTVGTGRQLADPVRGVPDVNVTSVALRVSLVPLHSVDDESAPGAISSATLEPKSAGALLTIRVIADAATTVEVAGTFSDWKPVPLTRTSAGWEAQIALQSGRHRVAVRINGGPWRAPGGTARVRDDFGGEAGLIVVP